MHHLRYTCRCRYWAFHQWSWVMFSSLHCYFWVVVEADIISIVLFSFFLEYFRPLRRSDTSHSNWFHSLKLLYWNFSALFQRKVGSCGCDQSRRHERRTTHDTVTNEEHNVSFSKQFYFLLTLGGCRKCINFANHNSSIFFCITMKMQEKDSFRQSDKLNIWEVVHHRTKFLNLDYFKNFCDLRKINEWGSFSGNGKWGTCSLIKTYNRLHRVLRDSFLAWEGWTQKVLFPQLTARPSKGALEKTLALIRKNKRHPAKKQQNLFYKSIDPTWSGVRWAKKPIRTMKGEEL